MSLWTCIIGGYGLMSGAAFCVYGFDKHRAANGGWRVRERTLHWLELLGGWPGAIVAQRVFHHKRRKTSYMLVFGAIMLVHAIAWGLYLRYGR